MRNLFTQLFSFSEKDQVKKGAGLADCSLGQVGKMSEEGAIEHPLITHSAPFGIRWKPAGEKGSTRVWKHVAMIFAVLVMSMANVGTAWGASPYSVDFTTEFPSTGTKSVNDGTVTINAKVSSKTYNNTSSTKVAFLDGTFLTVSATSACITSISLNANTDNNSNNHQIAYATSADGSTWSSNTNIGACANRQSTPSAHTVNFAEAVRYVRFTKVDNNISVGYISVTYSSGVTHTVTAATEDEDKGTAAAGSTTVAEGATTTITATPKSGYKFDHWTVSGTGASLSSTTSNPTTLTMGTANATVTAYFVEKVCPSSGTLYSLTVKSASYSNPGSTETNMVSTYATVTDGGAFLGCKDATNGQVQVKTDGSGTVYFNANNGYVKLVLDCPIQTGDQLTFENGSGSNQICFTTTNTRSATYTTASNTYTFPAAFNGASTIYVWRTSGSSTYMHSLTITRPAACTAPNHVDVSGNYRFTPGETISLTAAAYSSAGTNDPITSGVTYQWQKYNGSTWDDLTNTGNISGATSANLQISSCTTSNGGSYRCKASTGSGCDKYSDDGKDAHFIRIWTFNGNYNDDGFIANNITWTGATTGTVTLTLNANSTYKFKVFDNDGKWFGCNSGISSDATNWTFRTNEGNCSLTTGKVAGEYTFTIDIASAGDNNITVSVAYPMMRIYMECGSNGWCNDNPVFFAHSWKGGTSHDAMMTAHPCESGLYYADIPSYDTDLKFTRQKPGSTEIAWYGNSNFWNQSENITIGSNNKFTNTGWNTTPEPDEGTFSGSSYSPTTYTITFASNGSDGGSAMSNVTSIPCGEDRTLVANTWTKTGHTFAGWKTNVAITANSSAVAADGIVANQATINNINQNITLTAQWTPNNYDLTWNLGGGTTTSAGTGIASGVSSNTTSSVAYGTSLTAPTVTKTGYNFSAWSPSVASTMPAANTTYTAQWTAKTTTITINANTSNHGSTTPGTVTATYGSALPSFSAATGASGWTLTGYFTAATDGTKVINANGTLVASTDYADGSGNWKYETSTLTLYAQYEEEAAEECTNDYDSPATTTYATKTFLDVSATNYNTSASTNYYLTYSAYWMHNTYKTWTWWNSNDAGSNKESSTYAYANASTEGYLAIAASADGNNGYGGKKIHSTRRDSIWFTGATSVACINKGNSSATFTMEIFQVASNGTLSKVGSSYTNATTNVTALVSSALSASNYYLVKFYATAASNTYLYQVRFGNACSAETPSCTSVAAPTGLTCSAQTSSSLTFTWTKASNASTYTAKLYSDSGCESQVASQDLGDVATVTFSTLSASTTYYCKVQSHGDGSTYCAAGGTTSAASGTTSAAASALITYNLNVGTSASTTIKSSTSTTDGTNITNIDIDQTNDGANGDGASDRTTKLALATGTTASAVAEPDKYEVFTFKVACGKKVTPSEVKIKVANVGSTAGDNQNYKAVLSDTYGHSISNTFTGTKGDGTVEEFSITNGSSVYFQGVVTLKLWSCKGSGGNASAFRMGTPLEIYGEVANQATPAATITWNTQPANGQVGDPDFAYDVTCSDGSAVTVTSANTTYATIVGGKLHYAAAGTTHLVASATDACGNVLTPVNSNDFTVTVPVTYSITYHCNGAESGCPSNVAATTNLPSPLPTGMTKDGYDFGGWFTDSECTVAAVAGAALTGNTDLYAKWTEHIASECITIAYFEATAHNNSSSKPDNAGKYIYGYTNSAKTEAYAYTITSSTGDNKGQGTGESDYLRMNYGTTVTIYADNTTTSGTPASFSNVTSVSVDFKMMKSSYYTSFDIYVGSTKIANNVSLEGAAQSAFTTFTYNNLEQLSGTVRIVNKGSGSSNYHFYVDNIVICTADMAACTTPVIPSLSNQALCEGANATAWNATVTNAAAISAAGETVSYQWQLKNGSNWDDISGATSASYDVSDAVTEAMAGTYRVVVTVSKAGYSSSSATREVTLSVTESTEVTGITADKATVYPGNSVTLTATANTTVTWQWYTCTNAEGAGESSISGAENAAYTIASAPAAGTYYYKAKGSSSCGTAEYVYTLTVSASAGGDCETEIWVIKAADLPEGATAATHITTPFSAGSNESASITIDGNTYSITQRTSNATGPATIVVPEGNIGTLYILVKGNGGRSVILEKGGVEQWTATPDDGWQSLSVGNLAAGTYSLRSSNNLGWGLLALKLCSAVACSDPEVTASADNSTICVGGSVTFTAANAHASATYQWQKYSGSAWTNISGATSATYTIDPVAAGDEAKYRVIASHECNRTSNEVTLDVAAAPNFGSTVPASVSVMQTLALSISTVEATDAVKYRWYKSADATWDAGDTEIGTEKNLIKAYDGETAGSTYYIFCRAQNSCGTTTSSAIAVNVTAYVEEDCATRGNEGEAEFGFDYGSAGQGSYSSTACWTMNSNSKFLTYTAPEGKYFKTAKVTIASSSESKASYNWSTNGGSTYSAVALTVNSTLTERTIDLSAKGNVNSLQIGRNFNSTGSSGGTLYVSKICFEYTEACTSTTVTPSTSSVPYEMGGAWSNPTFTLTAAAVAAGGTLTYSSSNEDIASVDDEGAITFNGDAGTVTITASYAGDGTYCASSGSYTINVSCPGGAPKVAAASSVDLSGCNSSVTLLAKTQADGDFADGTYQWFRNGTEIDGATSSSYTATQAGIYTVERTNASGCTTPSTNSATVTSETTEPEVERLVPFQYYHVDKTYTDYMKMRHLFAVKNSGKLDGKSFKLYVSRNGEDPTDVTSSNALAIWPNADGRVDSVMLDLNKLNGKYSKGDELVYTCKAIDCSGNISETYKSTIQMHVIDTDTATLALICSGASGDGTRKTSDLVVGGDFLTGYNKADLCVQTGNTSFDKTQEWGLYTELKEEYIVTPVNGYAPFYKLNYEPFDILFLTDYPKASKSDAAKDILDDMAALCDYRPLFSFKTHMVAKSPSKWAAKGFTTSATENKADGRLNLNIVCYAHPMFDAIKTGDDVYNDIENTSAPLIYTMLSGTGHEGNKGMQGFEIAAAENFVTIGLTHYNAAIAKVGTNATWTPGSEDRMLVTVAERQTNIEARMILFSLNAGAHSKLTDKGEQVVLACLSYLLDDDPLHVADCSFTFDNGASNEHNAAWYAEHCPGCTGTKGDGLWSTAANWAPDYRLLPGEFTSVRIAAPVTVDLEHAHVLDARIKEGGHITIPAGKGLDMKGTLRRLDGSEISPTENEDIFLASNASGNGSLIFNNDKGDSKATVAMYTTALADIENMSATTSTWQYIGTPHNDVARATYNYYDSWLYQYSGSGWEVIPNGGPLVPFRGYCVTHPQANHTFVMYGTLTATTNVDIDVPAGYTVIANSWVAPIDITTLTDDDMEGIDDKTIYFFNTGSDAEGENGTGTAPGTYVAVPKNAASYVGNWQIPSMQGFYLSSSSAGTLHLDYGRHVRPAGERTTIVNNPMYAPRRAKEADEEPLVLKMFARGSRYHDKLVVLERADFTTGYDSGWDGEAWGGSDLSPQIYVIGGGRYDAVSAIPDFEGTVVAFCAGEDEAYTIDFIYDAENEPLYLFDTENNSYTQIVTGGAYHFTTSDKAAHSRFILTRHAPQIATGTELTSDGESAKARKLLIEDKMYILLNGMLYDATGKVVK